MRLVFLGGPGAGKGTQAKIFSQKLEIPHISTGDIFRATIQEGGAGAELLQKYMDQGKLVPDEVVLEIVGQRLKKEDCQKGFIFDGFPRTVEQAVGLDGFLERENRSLTGVLYFEISPEILVQRLMARRICEDCQALYNLKSKPPKEEGKCDLCGGPLVQREDDKAEVIRKRFEEYTERTAPLVAYYEDQGLLYKLEANAPVEGVTQIVEALLAEMNYEKK